MAYQPSANLKNQEINTNDQQRAVKTLQKILELTKQQNDLLRTIPNGWLTRDQYQSLLTKISGLQNDLVGIK